MGNRTCIIPGCGKPHDSHGYCGMHMARLRNHGDPTWEPPTREEIFWRSVDKSGDCWLWLGALVKNGYGKFGLKSELAHRVSYQIMIGPIPDGMHLDHLCRNRRCVNPAHLEPVSCKENLRRSDVVLGIRSAKTHCPHGHAYDEANTAHRNGRRHCRTCERIRAAKNRAKQKEGVAS